MIDGAGLTGFQALFADVLPFGFACGLEQAFLGVNRISIRKSLGILFEDSFAFADPLIEFIIDFDGANLGTGAAARTFFHIDEAGLLFNGYFEVTGFPFGLNNLGISVNTDIKMPSAFNQFWRQNTH